MLPTCNQGKPHSKNEVYKISDTVMPTMAEAIKSTKNLQEKKRNINMLHSMLRLQEAIDGNGLGSG